MAVRSKIFCKKGPAKRFAKAKRKQGFKAKVVRVYDVVHYKIRK